MADEPRNFDPDTTDANRTRQQGGGMGQRELSGQHDPDRNADVTAPKPPAPAGGRDDGTAGRDRGRYPERNAADRHDARGALGAGLEPPPPAAKAEGSRVNVVAVPGAAGCG